MPIRGVALAMREPVGVIGLLAPDDAPTSAELVDPATGRTRARVPMADAAMTVRAIEAAQSASHAWATTPPLVRARVMFRFRDLIERNAHELARSISSEHGKLHDDALGARRPFRRDRDLREFALALGARLVALLAAVLFALGRALFAIGYFIRPTLRAKSVSPARTIGRSPSTVRQMLLGECPGV